MTLFSMLGSSPRMRGAHVSPGSFEFLKGIIPAYAGSTGATTAQPILVRDHPRVCGEHPESPDGEVQVTGSSPRMRGALCPARPASCWYDGRLKRDHPRVCGEHSTFCTRTMDGSGSSPRMRGAPNLVYTPSGDEGIIPAYAGSTRTCAAPPASPGDHPRVCGEHAVTLPRLRLKTGSSPRMRGAHDFFGCDIFDVGIIPAYAGSTRTRTSATGSPRDHPRVCGEHADGQAVAASATGSSPRMRGALLRDRVWPVGRGIIPAYAGSTTPALCVPMSLRDHPRVCGEHLTMIV